MSRQNKLISRQCLPYAGISLVGYVAIGLGSGQGYFSYLFYILLAEFLVGIVILGVQKLPALQVLDLLADVFLGMALASVVSLPILFVIALFMPDEQGFGVAFGAGAGLVAVSTPSLVISVCIRALYQNLASKIQKP